VDKTDEFKELRSLIHEVGEERAEETREKHETLDEALEEYREDATGTGEFRKYIEFRNIVLAVEEDLDEGDGVYMRDDFESALSRLDAQTLRDKHFRGARSDLERVEGFVEKYERYEELREELRDELSTLKKRKEDLEREIEETEERLKKAREAEGVDASPLREAVEEYNESVRRDFEEFLRNAPAVEVARLGERTLEAPLVEDAPVESGTAERLSKYVGDETVERVLELADSSDAKLSHYVDDTDGFRDAVPRTFFETVDAERFELSYEPEGVVRRLAPELVSLVSFFADEETVAALRRVCGMAERGEYEPMRNALLAHEEAGDDAEDIEEELDELRTEKESVEERTERVREALDE